MKKAFEMKQKMFFFVSQALSVRHTNKTGKNVAGTTFRKSWEKYLIKKIIFRMDAGLRFVAILKVNSFTDTLQACYFQNTFLCRTPPGGCF